jgi:hypothetical protein
MNFAPGTWISAWKAVAFLLLLLSLASCAALPERQSRGIDHIVIVWLKRPGNADDKAKLVATSKELQRALPVMRGMSYGRPLPSKRPVVDDTFDLAFVMRFANRNDLAAYENSAIHQHAANEILRPLSRKIIIYDVEGE